MPPDSMQSGRESLRPRANIIRVIGNELISDDSVAVTELVKNSYDADATVVQLILEDR
jgi:DNA mismatch repair ATPase MutL